ncbi:MAG: serine/threonine protein kinase, partial [Planctomycetota bacterium]
MDAHGYRILEELGRGGMGAVYRAFDPRLGREVALKQLLPSAEGDPDLLLRLRREAEALARLRHPNVVAVHDLVSLGGRPTLVLEFVAGESLEERLRREGPLPPAEVLSLGEALASALAAAHAAGIVHRDVKPANVLLRAKSGAPLLTDFGLARDLRPEAERLTRTGSFLGTPTAVAPEQVDARFGEVGPATDVYGLGITLYAAATGRLPFAGKTALAALEQVVSRPPPAPRAFAPGLPPPLEDLLLRCLAKSPGERPPSAEALARELAALEARVAAGEFRGRRLAAPAALLLAAAAACAALVAASGSSVEDAAPGERPEGTGPVSLPGEGFAKGTLAPPR